MQKAGFGATFGHLTVKKALQKAEKYDFSCIFQKKAVILQAFYVRREGAAVR
jgi:hypothetical protein